MKESIIQKSIIQYLKLIKLGYVLSVTTAGVYDPRTKKFRTNTNQKGTSDILFWHKGTCIAIEVKTEKEYKFVTKHRIRLSVARTCITKRDKHLHDQILFIEGLKRTGNHGFFTDSITDTKNKLIEIFKNERT